MWAVLLFLLWYKLIIDIIWPPFLVGVKLSSFLNVFSRILLIFNGIFISYFWLNGVKDFIYVIWYYFNKSRLNKKYFRVINTDVSGADDKVLMVYCTCNDFDGKSLGKYLNQDYKYVRTIILDDSIDKDYINKVNQFALSNNIKVVRRQNREGFKAGNINHYLQSQQYIDDGGYDYVVFLDSDEILPNNFIIECLKNFYCYYDIGIVQANHISTRNRNFL